MTSGAVVLSIIYSAWSWMSVRRARGRIEASVARAEAAMDRIKALL